MIEGLETVFLSALSLFALLGMVSLLFLPFAVVQKQEEPKSAEDKFLDSVEEQRKRAIKAKHEEERRKLAERYAAEKQALEEEFEREDRERLAKYKARGDQDEKRGSYRGLEDIEN